MHSLESGAYEWLLRAREWRPVWRHVVNRDGRRHWRRHAPDPRESPARSRIVADLERDGIAVARLDDLVASPGLGELLGYAERERSSSRVATELARKEARTPSCKDDLLVHLYGGYDQDDARIDFANPFSQLALDEAILGTAAAYLGVSPWFQNFSLHVTTLRPEGDPRRFSQCWHQDPEDRSQLKVFVYLTDVLDEGAGPFTYLAGGHAGGRHRRRVRRRPGRGLYIGDRKFAKSFPAEDVRSCLGKAGTLIFCDTSGFHRGGYATRSRRTMFSATYTSRAALRDRNFRIEDPVPISLSALGRYALSSR